MSFNDEPQTPSPFKWISNTNLLRRGRTVRVKRGQNLLARGENSTRVYIVMDGILQVVLYSPSGRQVSLRELIEGDIFGELAAIDGEDRCANILAISDSRLTAFDRTDFLNAIHLSSEAVDWLLKQLAARVRSLTEKIFELSVLNVQARLHCELLRLAQCALASGRQEIFPAPTHGELAHRIGANREAVTREIKELSARNVIRTDRRRLEFVDIARLQDLVDKIGLETDSILSGSVPKWK
jgi:CRP/FNR family transcriptional regulator, cyclic AMP receptor protein